MAFLGISEGLQISLFHPLSQVRFLSFFQCLFFATLEVVLESGSFFLPRPPCMRHDVGGQWWQQRVNWGRRRSILTSPGCW